MYACYLHSYSRHHEDYKLAERCFYRKKAVHRGWYIHLSKGLVLGIHIPSLWHTQNRNQWTMRLWKIISLYNIFTVLSGLSLSLFFATVFIFIFCVIHQNEESFYAFIHSNIQSFGMKKKLTVHFAYSDFSLICFIISL